MGITELMIHNFKDSITIGSDFNFKGINGIVLEKYKYHLLLMRPSGYRECFCWTELLASE